MNDLIALRITSHRSYDRIRSFLCEHGEPFACYYKDLSTPGYFTVCPARLASEAAKLKGITRARGIKAEDLRKCWGGNE